MITIDEIKNVSFRKAGRQGYMAEDVDAFIDEVIVSFEQLKKEKTNLVHKIDVLATRVEQYRADEETVRNALLASQKVSDACIREAKEKAAKIIREAEAKAQSLLVDTNRMTAVEKENYLQLQADAVALKSELIELYKKHLKTIDDLPSSVDLEASRSELDEKYPTTSVEPTVVKEVISDEVVNQAMQTEDVSAQETKVEETVQEQVAAPVAPQKPSRFGRLKFGDNYDVSAE